MAIEVIDAKVGNGVVAGSLDGHEWVISSTPVTSILRVDETDHRAELVGVKYSNHYLDDNPKGNRKPDEYTRVTMLVSGGPWEQRMWNPRTRLNVTYRLNAWQPGPYHPRGQATLVTVTYRKLTGAPERTAEP